MSLLKCSVQIDSLRPNNLEFVRYIYVSALSRADSGDAGLLGELIARAVLDNLY